MNHSKIFLRDFCFAINITSCRSTCTARGPRPPQFKLNNFFNEHFPKLIFFFKSILSRKNWRDGSELLLLKNGTVNGTPTNQVIAEGPGNFGDFRNIFLLNLGEDQKRSYHLNKGPLALCHTVNPTLVIALRSQKGEMRTWGSNF